MKKLRIIFLSLISINALFGAAVLRRATSINTTILRRLCSNTVKTHAYYVDAAAKHIPQSDLMQNLLGEFTHLERIHSATVLKAAYLSSSEEQDLILKALIQAEEEHKPDHKIDNLENFIKKFISESKNAKHKNPQTFEEARRMRNFWGKYYYTRKD